MNHVVVAVLDVKAEVFGRPHFMRTEGEAIRSFLDEVNSKDENNPLHKHPEDYILYQIGYYDDLVGRFENLSTIKMLVQGSQLKEVK